MTRKLDERPHRAPRWVRAAVLTGGLGSLVACGGGRHPNGQPPTCGPCCHTPDGWECKQMQAKPEPPAAVDAGVVD
jgi:hypothetical protein